MLRFIFPTILIIGSIAGFTSMVAPLYKEVQSLQAQISSYDEALTNSKLLEAERDRLTQKFNSMSPADIDKLGKLLPDSVENIRLILEIEKLASTYGMALKDVKYDAKVTEFKKDAKNTTTQPNPTPNQAGQDKTSNKDYGSWDLSFAVEGKYSDFLKFLTDLEHNLRIIDLTSIQFSSAERIASKDKNTTAMDEMYRYGFRVKTYWLKN